MLVCKFKMRSLDGSSVRVRGKGMDAGRIPCMEVRFLLSSTYFNFLLYNLYSKEIF